MYQVNEILDKLNSGKGAYGALPDGDINGPVTLADIMVLSFEEVRELADDRLSWSETNFLYGRAQDALKQSRMLDARILGRANPQLLNVTGLGIAPSSVQNEYNAVFPQRTSSFVRPGSVASMFSPAGYLTELYREARKLHSASSEYHLDKRRPDIGKLLLSQENMDEELSTLTLSNELLVDSIKKKAHKNYDGVMELLSTYRPTGELPYHQPFEAVRQSVILQDQELKAFRNNPSVLARMNPGILAGMAGGISPELHAILTEKITQQNAEDLMKKNFGDAGVSYDVVDLARYYEVSPDEITSCIKLLPGGRSAWELLTSGETSWGINDFEKGKQYYNGDHLLVHTGAQSSSDRILIMREPGTNYYRFNYVEVLPLPGGNCRFQFAVKNGPTDTIQIGTKGPTSNDLLEGGELVVLDKDFSLDVTLDGLPDGIEIAVTRWSTNGGYHYNSAHFRRFSLHESVLNLNKLVRLCRATGLSPVDAGMILRSINNNLDIAPEVLETFLRARLYMYRYGIGASSAVVLAGSNIGGNGPGEQAGEFDRLFNTPLLNRKAFFVMDKTEIELQPTKVTDTFHTSVLKRAFQVDDTGLYTMWQLANGHNKTLKMACSLENLSALYRVSLLASVHRLDIHELAALLSVSPYATMAIRTLSVEELGKLVGFIERHVSWLQQLGWTAGDLYVMATTRHDRAMTPEIAGLVDTLSTGLADQEKNDPSLAAIIDNTAPLVAAATQLDSVEMASGLLLWLDQIKPEDLDVLQFVRLACKEKLTQQETTKLVGFCQVLGQLVLFVKRSGLGAELVLWMVRHPAALLKAKTLPHELATLHELTAVQAFLNRCGSHASQILTSLSGNSASAKNNLAPETVAAALGIDEQAVKLALGKVSTRAYFYSWADLRDALQWVDVADTFGITPKDVKRLTDLQYTSRYADWLTASQILQAGLDGQQTEQLQAELDEGLSAACSSYAVRNLSPSWVTSRDKLYSWLLIDSQVSAQIKTTRIAEAISSVQLYVNRALAGMEEGVVAAVRSERFFGSDWENYNKRYSTWAGVSQLAYYPENYVDPTLRAGQTGMMEEMLQALSQSQLTSDTVEGAFKTYMTRFEEVANLDVISGYHDGLRAEKGIIYLIGRSAGNEYYWRSADMDKFTDGTLPASAWSEWKKIAAAVTPVSNLIRPVIFQSRLHLFWVERRDAGKTSGNTTVSATDYLLRSSHILHDGTWSAPVTIGLKDGALLPLRDGNNEISLEQTGMYCAKDAEQEKLHILLYKKEASYPTWPSVLKGITIFSDGTTQKIPEERTVIKAGGITHQLDTTTDTRLNTCYVAVEGDYRVIAGAILERGSKPGDQNLTTIPNSRLFNVTAVAEGNKIKIGFSAEGRIEIGPGPRARDGHWIRRAAGGFGDELCVPIRHTVAHWFSNRNLWAHCVVNKTKRTVYFQVHNGYIWDGSWSYKPHYAIVSRGGTPSSSYVTTSSGGYWSKHDSRLASMPGDICLCRSDPFPTSGPDVRFTDFKLVDLRLTKNIATIKVAGAGSGSFQADGVTLAPDAGTFIFTNKSFTLPLAAFKNGSARLDFTMDVRAPGGDFSFLGSRTLSVAFALVKQNTRPVIRLCRTGEGAQYLEFEFHRIRVNTLFARQLVARANSGLDHVLSMQTQQLPEPGLGEGTYCTLTLKPYDKAIHGSLPDFRIVQYDSLKQNDQHVLAKGVLSKTSSTRITVFVPLHAHGRHKDSLWLYAIYNKGEVGNCIKLVRDGNSWKLDPSYLDGTFEGLESVRCDNTGLMDFNGANALYFWEMFYYVPMMVFRRLLGESKFTEATQWIRYIWRPEGYLLNGQAAPYRWNVRPLEEDTGWNSDPLDAVDPDAVAQADPMHYKVATFMSFLDLLIARGDAAYRKLERDALNEAKMWYVQALDMLGDEPYGHDGNNWSSPSLSSAASKTLQARTYQGLMNLREPAETAETYTANSLTGLFLPQQNEKLAGYWRTLRQRLYNLRHNLSIDGNPLSLPVYARPADPTALLSAAVNASSGGSALPQAVMPVHRFPIALESARSMVGQLIQFGNTLLGLTERQDAEALSELLQVQGSELVLQGVALQERSIAELDADKVALEEVRNGAQARLNTYSALFDEDVNRGEQRAMALSLAASKTSIGSSAVFMAAAGLDTVPNIYGMAVGGSQYGAIARAVGTGIEIGAAVQRMEADRISQSEMYRRRRQEWETQRNNAEIEIRQIDAQLAALGVRREAAVLQKNYLETQQSQTSAQLAFLQNKFTRKALYNWLRGKLAAIYHQFYDLTVSRCLMAEEAYRYEQADSASSFIRPGAWNGTHSGLLAGETLMLNLARMEQRYLQKARREMEITRTVCLSEVYGKLSNGKNFALADQLPKLLAKGKGHFGTGSDGLEISADKQLRASLKLSGLDIGKDYPDSLGKIRRIKQISVTLPALIGPYQDVRAVLSYGGSMVPRGCEAIAVSHGMNDSGQFQLDFNDGRWLPFEGIPVDDNGTLVLSFPDAIGRQKALLESLSDIILHIRYTIAK